MTKFEQLFEQAIKRIIKLASEHNKELPQAEYFVEWMEDQKPGCSRMQREINQVPYFDSMYRDLNEEIESSKEVVEFRTYIEIFLKKHGKFSPFYPVDRSIKMQAENLFSSYFLEMKRLSVSKKSIQKVCKQFEEDICSDDAQLIIVYQVEGLEATTSFCLDDGITFRPVTMKDIEECCYYRRFEMRNPYSAKLNLNDWICEVRKPICKASAYAMPDVTKEITYNNSHDLEAFIAEVISLCLPARISLLNMYRTIESPYLDFGSVFGTIKTHTAYHADPSQGKVRINKYQIKKLQEIFKQLKAIKGTKRFADLDLALRRLRAAAGRQNVEDHLVDCVIGMEYLLAPDGEKGEVTYKCKMRGASLLSDRFGDVEQRKKFLGDLYKKRSQIVHGNKKAKKNLKEFSQKAEDALRELVFWYITKGITIGSRQDIVNVLDAAAIKGGSRIRRIA